MNRLAQETSPYLLQHRTIPWTGIPGRGGAGPSRHEDKPIFLSIGYSACHWCHVMEHESFENERIAALLNEHFVCIKVDREERPDLDHIYMQAVQMITGRGGWPFSAFLTPDLQPFYGGTYWPPDAAHGHARLRRGAAGGRRRLDRAPRTGRCSRPQQLTAAMRTTRRRPRRRRGCHWICCHGAQQRLASSL